MLDRENIRSEETSADNVIKTLAIGLAAKNHIN